ncbi:MAG: hypothetical protein ACK57S_02265 [Brevundimonas sp.]
MRDQHHDLSLRSALAPAVYSANAAGTVIDRRDFQSLTFLIQTGVGGISFTTTNKITYVLEDSDDGSTFAAVDAEDVVGANPVSGVIRAITAAHAQPSVTQCGYIGDKRYVRLTAQFGGTHGTGTAIAASAVLGHPRQRPVA